MPVWRLCCISIGISDLQRLGTDFLDQLQQLQPAKNNIITEVKNQIQAQVAKIAKLEQLQTPPAEGIQLL